MGGPRSGSLKPWWEVSIGKTGGGGGLHLPRVSKLLWGFSRIKRKAFSCPWEALAGPGARAWRWGQAPQPRSRGPPCCGVATGRSLSLNREPPAGLWMLPGSTEVHAGRIQTGARRKWGALQGPGGCGRPFPERRDPPRGCLDAGAASPCRGRGGRTGGSRTPGPAAPSGPASPSPHTQAVPS